MNGQKKEMSRIFQAMQKAEPATVRLPMPGEEEDFSPRLNFFESDGRAPCRLDPLVAQMVNPGELWMERIRAMRERLRTLEQAETHRSYGLVSTRAGEGKTSIGIALSLVLSQEPGMKVLLVDADLRKPEVESLLGLEPASGLADWLENPRREVPVRRLAQYGTYVLSAGRPPAKPWQLVSSPRFKELLAAARSHFDFVIVDCPPQGPVADAARIQDYLDGLLLVVRARAASRENILASVENLRRDKILGVVFNCVRSVDADPGASLEKRR